MNSDYSIEETDKLVSQVTERRTPLIWRVGGVERILSAKISLKNSVLILLYHNRGMAFDALARATEAKDAYLRRTLRELHAKRQIEFCEEENFSEISPMGSKLAEEILTKMAT